VSRIFLLEINYQNFISNEIFLLDANKTQKKKTNKNKSCMILLFLKEENSVLGHHKECKKNILSQYPKCFF